MRSRDDDGPSGTPSRTIDWSRFAEITICRSSVFAMLGTIACYWQKAEVHALPPLA